MSQKAIPDTMPVGESYYPNIYVWNFLQKLEKSPHETATAYLEADGNGHQMTSSPQPDAVETEHLATLGVTKKKTYRVWTY